MTAGLPRLKESTFIGEYPFAWIKFEDDVLPLEINLEAYTPLIPLNPEDSGIPCAILTYTLRNTSAKAVDITLAASMMNPVGGIRRNVYDFIDASTKGKTINEYKDAHSYRGLYLHAAEIDDSDLEFGSMSLTTDHQNLTVKPVWRRGGWFDFFA
jgi:uncharacterized protein (DUF608 family)